MDDTLRPLISELLDTYVNLQNEQDLPGLLSLLHPHSWSYTASQQLLMNLFATYELKFTLLDQHLIARDGDYVLARAAVRTEKLTGPEFQDNTADILVIFRRMEEHWKIWSQAPLTLLPQP